MQYALMFWADPEVAEGMSEEERAAVTREFEVLLYDDPRLVSSLRLESPDTATSVRVIGGKTLMTDGPFADTKEVMGGLAIFEADNLDEVLEIAERIPVARLGGGVEVRPVMQR